MRVTVRHREKKAKKDYGREESGKTFTTKEV